MAKLAVRMTQWGGGHGIDTLPTTILPFNLNHELMVGIKAALTSGRKESQQIKSRMPLDKPIFDGGLKDRGVEAGVGKYTIKQYKDLQDILARAQK